MSEKAFFDGLVMGWFLLAAATFISLFFVVAPYGRHFRGGWGAIISNKLGWLIMESVSPVAFAVCFAIGNNRT